MIKSPLVVKSNASNRPNNDSDLMMKDWLAEKNKMSLLTNQTNMLVTKFYIVPMDNSLVPFITGNSHLVKTNKQAVELWIQTKLTEHPNIENDELVKLFKNLLFSINPTADFSECW